MLVFSEGDRIVGKAGRLYNLKGVDMAKVSAFGTTFAVDGSVPVDERLQQLTLIYLKKAFSNICMPFVTANDLISL